MSAVHRYFENLLGDLLKCWECNGTGRMEYGEVPKVDLDPSKGAEIYDGPDAKKTHEKCRQCDGTGKATWK